MYSFYSWHTCVYLCTLTGAFELIGWKPVEPNFATCGWPQCYGSPYNPVFSPGPNSSLSPTYIPTPIPTQRPTLCLGDSYNDLKQRTHSPTHSPEPINNRMHSTEERMFGFVSNVSIPIGVGIISSIFACICAACFCVSSVKRRDYVELEEDITL